MVVEIKIEDEAIQSSFNKALYECKTESGLTVAECIEKQTPKMAMWTFKPFFNCPVCSNELHEKQRYCENCGQALDWSDNNDTD